MGISYIPGPEATLGPAIAELFQSIGTAVAPHAEFRKKFEQALATNPSMVQQLADLEFKSPGSVTEAFKDYLSPQTRDAILGAKPSVKAQGEAAVGGAIPSVAGVTADQLPEQPTIAQIGAVRELTGVRPNELGQESLEGTQRKAAIEYLGSLSAADRQKLGAYSTLPAIMNDQHFLAQLQLTRDMFNARKADRIEESRLRLQEANAIWWQEHQGVGTAEEWKDYFSEAGRARLAKIKEGGMASLTSDDVRLLQIDEAFQAAPAERRSLVLGRIELGLNRSIKAVNEAGTESERTAQLAGLNQLLQERSRYGAPLVTAKYTTPAWTKNVPGLEKLFPSSLRFFDQKNNEIDENSVTAPVVAPSVQSSAPPAAQPAAPAAPADTSTFARARARALQLQAQGMSPAAIAAKLRAEGFNIK